MNKLPITNFKLKEKQKLDSTILELKLKLETKKQNEL